MGIDNCVCDSCSKETDVIFPLYILDELPTGGEQMVRKYYCLVCKSDLEDAINITEEENLE